MINYLIMKTMAFGSYESQSKLGLQVKVKHCLLPKHREKLLFMNDLFITLL